MFVAISYIAGNSFLLYGNLSLLLTGEGMVALFGSPFLYFMAQPAYSISDPSKIVFVLNALGIVIGAVGLLALRGFKKSTNWIFVWYGIATYGFLSMIYDALFMPTPKSDELAIVSLINASLILVASFIVHLSRKGTSLWATKP